MSARRLHQVDSTMDMGPADYAVNAADKRGPRLRRSCELCRSSKGRCIPSEEDPSRCQRCVRDDKTCHFMEAKPRPKRAKNSRIRVAEMEVKLDSLLSLLSSSKAENLTPTPTPEPAVHHYPSPSGIGSLHLIGHQNGAWPKLSQQSLNLPSFPLYPSFDRLQDVISQGIIEFQVAEEYVRVFKTKAHTFPFVVIPPHMSLDALRRERPFLLLSILAYASDGNVRLQNQLELELRETLSRKIIVNCEKSLDLLQGLLVYLTWYHFYFDPAKQQIYQLCQIAAAMVVDLGFHKKMKQASMTTTLFFPKLPEEELEARRTYIGCYYVTASLCQSLRKPYNLKSNDYLEECAQSLAAAAHNDTDFLMPYFVHIQRLSEEVCRAFDYDASYELPPLDSVRTEILVKAFQNRFKRMEAAFPQEVWSNVSLKISFYRLRIYINEVGFHASPPSDEDAMSDQSCLQSWYYSQERNDCLVSCLAATKEYLDQVLSLSDNNFLDFTLIKFIYLIYAVEILGSFATKYNDRMINAIHVQKSTDFDYYIDGLSEKLLRSIAATKGPSANPYLSHLIDLFQRSKVWYAQMQLDPAKVDYCALGRPEYTFMEIMPMLVSRCMDFSIVGKSSCGSPNSDQMWTELMSESSLDPSYITMNGCS